MSQFEGVLGVHYSMILSNTISFIVLNIGVFVGVKNISDKRLA